MIVPFTYYLHDDFSSEEFKDELERSTGIAIDAELMEKIGRPFYEIRFDCVLDTKSGVIAFRSVGPVGGHDART